MKCDKHTMLLYAVTDRAWVGEQTLYQQVESALKGGATCVQLREKQLGDADFLQEAIQIHALCQQYGVPLFINDNVEVALQCHAEGIHVGQDDMAAAQVRQRVGDGVMIGVSAHTVQEALDAVAHGADYLGVGAVFATHTKTDVSEMPRQTLLDICKFSFILMSSVVPSAMTWPPFAPASGPISMSQSASLKICVSWSTRRTELPSSMRSCITPVRPTMFAGCKPMEGSSSTYKTPVVRLRTARASCMRWRSPVESVEAARSSVR